MSSIYLTYKVGFLGLLSRNASSSCPMYMAANAGANLVPMAIPWVCVNSKLSNLNMLFLVHTLIGQVGKPFVSAAEIFSKMRQSLHYG